MPADERSVNAVYLPRSVAGTVVSATEKSRMCSSWISARLIGAAGGLARDVQPLGASFGSARSTRRLCRESAVSATEYGSVTLLTTSFRTLGAQTVTSYR